MQVETTDQLASNISLSAKSSAVIDINNYTTGLGTVNKGTMKASINAVQSFGLITFTGAPTAAETCVIAGVTFTARASGATGNEFNIGGTISITAANLAAAINASTSLSGIVTATSLLGVVTITSVVPGAIGNFITLTESLSNATATAFASGANGNTFTTISFL